jgi:hypothetical protein
MGSTSISFLVVVLAGWMIFRLLTCLNALTMMAFTTWPSYPDPKLEQMVVQDLAKSLFTGLIPGPIVGLRNGGFAYIGSVQDTCKNRSQGQQDAGCPERVPPDCQKCLSSQELAACLFASRKVHLPGQRQPLSVPKWLQHVSDQGQRCGMSHFRCCSGGLRLPSGPCDLSYPLIFSCIVSIA